MSGEKIAVVMPPAELMVQHRDQFHAMKSSLAAGETMTIGNKPYIKRNGWRMIAAGFNINLELVKDNDGKVLHTRMAGEDDVGKYYVHTYVARATLPSGKFAECEGGCSSRDSFFGKSHGAWKPLSEIDEADIIATAQTVAYNRAISDLVGGAEVSAEEMMGKESVSFDKEAYPGSAKPQDKQRSDDMISEAQVGFVKMLMGKANMDADARARMKKEYGVKVYGDLTKSQLDSIKKKLVDNGDIFIKKVDGKDKVFGADEIPPDENPIAQDHSEMIEDGEIVEE